ncbi:MAG: hypothetical protein ACI8PT_004124 [Gammaproteobacteria bacterium]|jgi:hypothetical protein
MPSSRRVFLSIIGGGIVLAAGGAAGFAFTRTPTKALAPWEQAGDYAEPRRRALSYAILAPNPHNRQPWRVSLSTPNEIAIWRDKTKNLPHTDPHDRQLTIGMGCFLEQLSIAATATGHAVTFELFPDGDNGPVAVAQFHSGAAPDPLAEHMLARRSCKEPFALTPVNREPALLALADIHSEPNMVAQIRALTWQAWITEATTPRTIKESVDLFRLGKTEIENSPDGIDLGGPFLETLMAVGALTREGQLDPNSSEFRQTIAIYKEMLEATPAYAVLRTANNSRESQIDAGRRWLRLNLAATALGLSLHPVSQALQEYPEMAVHYRAIHELLATSGETVQMLGRLGYGPDVAQSPRWPLDAKIMQG